MDTHNLVVFPQHAKLNGMLDAPFKAAIDVPLPVRFLEIRLLLRVEEWVDASVEVRILDLVSVLITL